MRAQLAAAFDEMGFPAEASAFLLKLWDAIQFLDDVMDGDRPDLAAIYTVLIELPADPFYAVHRGVLTGALVTQYHKWQAANAAERLKVSLDRAYMWRAGYYDVVLLVAALCLPRERTEALAVRILNLYGETLDDYKLEIFNNA